MSSHGVVIVGGGLAAVRIVEQLRKSEYSGPITVVSDEEHPPYDRPPLSKEILQNEDTGLADVALKPVDFYADNDITLRLGSAATSLDTAARTVTLGDGTELSYDDLIIATGLVPKRIPSLPDLAGIRVLRTIGESLALRQHAARASRAVVIGAGFIGCEVAASLRKLGVAVVLVEPQPAPLAGVLGEPIGQLIARVHRAEGVDVRTGVGVAEVRGDDHVRQVVLGDGSEIDADLVIISTPSMFLGPAGKKLSSKLQAKFIWDVRDLTWLYAKESTDAGLLGRIVTCFLEVWMVKNLEAANLVFTATEGIREAIINEYSLPADKVITVVNGISRDFLDAFRMPTKLSGRPATVLYLGLLGYNQGIGM